MKIYLAARYHTYPHMQRRAHTLTLHGHEVTSRWIWGDHELRATGNAAEDNARFAQEDVQDLCRADMLLSFSEPAESAEGKPSRGGRHVEFGLALALKKDIALIDHRENVFHWLPQVKVYSSLPEWLATHHR